MYGATDVDRALCVMTAILCWMRVRQAASEETLIASGVDTSALLTDDPGDVVLSSLQLLDDCNRSAMQQCELQ